MIIYLDKQFNKSVPREKRRICSEKIQRLLDAIEDGSERTFLNASNAKKMKGTEYIWKFRVTDSDRILYVHAEHVPHLSGHPGAIVLLRYAGHDEQGTAAGNLGLSAVEVGREYQSDFRFTEDTTPEETQKYFSRMLIHRIGKDQISAYMNESESAYDVVLSREQQNILCTAQYPLVLYGCAGSGKTILSAHMLYQAMFCNPAARGLYTALSEKLPLEVSRLFRNIDTAEMSEDARQKQVDFLSVSALMTQRLNLKPNRLVQYDDFRYVFCDTPGEIAGRIRQMETHGVGMLDLWAEIRGILKGHLDENWQWQDPILRSGLDDPAVRFLEREGFIEAADKKYQSYRKTREFSGIPIVPRVKASLNETTQMSDRKKAEVLENAEKIDTHFSRFNPARVSLTIQEYLDLSDEYSVYSTPVRAEIYELYKLYQNWLDQSGYYDENDLARRFAAESAGLYDFAAVDEVQDLTEMQIYAIFRSCRNPADMVFAGDVHQVVNPTYYSEERIRKLYFTHCGHMQVSVEALKKNFRSQDKIVNLANDLSRIRKQRIGSRSLLSEQSEESAIEGWRPMRLLAQDHNLGDMVRRISELPYAAVIVPDQETADMLEEYLDGDENRNIYTVPEIKGLEKRYIFCCNIVSRYHDAWKDIFSQADIRKNVKYRYYFNTLYVAVTRAQNYLCFYEDRIPEPMLQWADTFTDTVSRFNEEKLFLTQDENAGEGWYESALKCEENGDYQRAIAQFKKSAFGDYPECIRRCRIRQMLAMHHDREAMSACIRWKAYPQLPLIASEASEETVASAAEKLYALMTGEGKKISVLSLLEELRCYDPEECILPDLMDRITDTAFDKISELTDRVRDLTKRMC